MLNKIKLRIKKQAQNWYWFLFFVSLLVGVMLTLYVGKQKDTEMRNNLYTYANTIERSIDWRPHTAVLNKQPDKLAPYELAELEHQLNSACRANKDCHFIYLLYRDDNQAKFLLDASPQPISEISKLGEVFVEASHDLKDALHYQHSLVEGPVTDHWGTWVSVYMPIEWTMGQDNFVMLGIDVAVKGWNKRIFEAMVVPMLATCVFLGILGSFVYHARKREKLLAQLYSSAHVLSEIANNDALTGLPNRRLLEDRMMQALKASSRSDYIVAVLFLDLDFFKTVNDTHGHLVGDELLKLVGMRLKHSLRAEDTVARIGGDEFVVLLPTLNEMLQASAMAQKIITSLARPFTMGDLSMQLGVSIGIAFYPTHADEPNDLISQADIAMYVAKRKGRNCYAVYNEEFPA